MITEAARLAVNIETRLIGLGALRKIEGITAAVKKSHQEMAASSKKVAEASKAAAEGSKKAWQESCAAVTRVAKQTSDLRHTFGN